MRSRGARLHSVSSRATKAFDPAALDEGAAVETIAGAAQADDFVAVALLDAALDDDEQRVRRAVAGDQRLAGAEIADVERRFDGADLLRRQPVERRIGRIE